ncbi:hypothetical protein RvY_07456 [Ramazzottius varieornatus]|uniref:Uncharacterized protein n=1 Tax=Ramazzottius varieornatus TaxID=947166 RepID=A0A1D1V295_RAMVA|nr:hypothetical protein RvY_07456 [Ramazzottius varieornatus]
MVLLTAVMTSEDNMFADLVMLIVPKAATWKYDVQPQSVLLTVYRLRYENRVVRVSDCVGLEYCRDGSNPLGYSLIPTISSSGNRMDLSILPELVDQEKLTSPLEIQRVVDHLELSRKISEQRKI